MYVPRSDACTAREGRRRSTFITARTKFNRDYLFTQTYLTYVAREGRRRLTHTLYRLQDLSHSTNSQLCTLKLGNYLLGTKTKITIGQIS